ncbi:putative ABC transporter ATP-binding protein [bioreactor metagenome]|uniref:Putative ABC transporter ATP-binding protein n=1 Tax=bioreactor metagenome TaxID=1076179 RepID=A0A644XFG2_9ZZZZ
MFKKLISYLGAYRKEAILAPALVILEVICELILPRLMAGIVDVGIANGDTAYIYMSGLKMLVLAILSMACGVLSAKFAAIAGYGFGANLRRAMFERIQTFSFADIDGFSSASLVTRMTNDVSQLQQLVAMGLRLLARAPVMLVAALAIAISINAKLALVLLAVIPVLAVSVGFLLKVCSGLFKTMQQRIDGLNSTVQEHLVAIRVVKAFVRADYEKAKFKKSNDALTDAALAAATRIILVQPVMMICLFGATVGVLWIGGRQVLGGTMLIGDLSSFLSYIFQILISIMIVAMALLQLSRAAACATRICQVLDAESAIRDGKLSTNQLPPPRGKVEFQNVSFKYRAEGSGDLVLSDLNFEIEPGELIAVVGGTGTGKSSLVNLIPRFYDVTSGTVLVDGVDVRDYSLEDLRSRIGMVLQNNVLFSGTIRENLLWGKKDATEEEVEQAAEDAQALDFIQSFPDGMQTHVEQGGVNLSGGQKQRLCIARAILKKPAILILDDSTSAVDTVTEAKIWKAFHSNLKDTTVILIAQRISSVAYADRVIVLDDGKISGIGTHSELLAKNAIYREICESQQEGVLE